MKRTLLIFFPLCLFASLQSTFAGDNKQDAISWAGIVAVEDTNSYVFIDYIRGAKLNIGNTLDFKVSCFSTPSVTIAVERSSDGVNFTSLNEEFATATRCQQPFNFTDQRPQPGLNYYRVKTTDIDGGKTYSFTVPILNTQKGLHVGLITPNPVLSSSVVQISSAEKQTVSIIVSALNGKQISNQKVALIAGSNEIYLNLGKISKGTYQLTLVTSEGERQGLRFLKQ